MKLTNDNLYVVAEGLMELSKVKLSGKLALKIFRIKKKIDDVLTPALQAIQAVEDTKEKQKIALDEVEIEIEKLNMNDFESVDGLKPETLFKIEKIIIEGE